MLKKVITYTDYDGNERTESFYFNLNEDELLEMEMGVDGGYVEWIQKIVAAKNVPALIKVFKKFIHKSYGVKSADGRNFVKNEQVLADFIGTRAYSKLYMELATDDKKAAEFVNNIIPTKEEPSSTNHPALQN